MHFIIQHIYRELGIEYIYVGEDEVQKKQKNIKQSLQIMKGDNIKISRGRREVKKEGNSKSMASVSSKKPIDTKRLPNVREQRLKRSVDIESFDGRFKRLCSSLKRTPCIWTYFNLGIDLFGEASPERRTSIKNILSSLRMPQGTYSFIPYTAPNVEGDIELKIDEFLGILQLFTPSLVLFFGEQSLKDIVPHYSGAMWEEFIIFPPVRALVLPDMECVDKEQEFLVQYLRQYTKSIGLCR